jgi:hypothetical protein
MKNGSRLRNAGIYVAGTIIAFLGVSLVGCGDGRRLFEGPIDLGVEGAYGFSEAGSKAFEKDKKKDDLQEKIDTAYRTKN